MVGIGAAIGLGPQFPIDVRMQRVDHGDPRVAFVPIGRQVDGDLFRLRVEHGDLGLPHHAFPDVSILIHRDHEATRRKAGPRDGNRIARDLAGLGVEFRDDMVLEIGEPDVARLVEECVMRRGGFRKIIGRDDGLSRFAGRPGLRFQFIAPGFPGTEIDRSDVGREFLLRLARRTAQYLVCVLMEERKIGRSVGTMRRHALHDDRHFRCIFLGKDRTLQAVTIETSQQCHFLLVRARRALKPLAVGHLQGENIRRGLGEANVEFRGAAGLYRCRCRLERVADGTHGDVISTGREPVLRETVLPLRVGADRNHDGRARALGADHNAFHFSFLR